MVSGDDTSSNENVEFQNDRILSVAQELVYGCSACKNGQQNTLGSVAHSIRWPDRDESIP